jgi:hypothetical protein
MRRRKGNVCVAGKFRVCDVREEHEGLQCIANHPGFQTVCLDPYVLQVHITNIASQTLLTSKL